MNSRSELLTILRRISIITGLAILFISIQFSYDGFDQSIRGANTGYGTMAIIIGYTLAIVFSVIEFIFGTAYRELNWTLRGIGVFAYIYSIYTNYLGIKHLLGADEFMSWSLAIMMDVYPEPAIAWALGEALTGDLLGNLGKLIFGDKTPPKPSIGFSALNNTVSNKPDYKHTSFGTQKHHGTPNPRKVKSNLFMNSYTDKFKK
jgi:hypothetical protein